MSKGVKYLLRLIGEAFLEVGVRANSTEIFTEIISVHYDDFPDSLKQHFLEVIFDYFQADELNLDDFTEFEEFYEDFTTFSKNQTELN